MKYKGDTCKVEGCTEPRWDGTALAFCKAHARAYKQEKNRAAWAKRKARPQTLSVLLVDKARGEALRMTGVVTERLPLEDLRGDGTQYERVALALVGKGR